MADISKCELHTCKVKETCYRYTSIANPFSQVYLQPNFDSKGKCLQYLPNKAK